MTRRLNTFQPGTLSQDPIERLQESHSISYYVSTFTKLICYFLRVVDGHFVQELFTVTSSQQDAQDSLHATVQLYLDFLASHPEPMPSDGDDEDADEGAGARRQDHEAQAKEHESEIDCCTGRLCTALVKHRSLSSNLWSPMLSYCAVSAWDGSEQT